VSGLDHTLKPSGPLRRIEVISGFGGRRRWSVDEKARIVEETLAPGAVVSEVARRHGLLPQQLFGWRREARRPDEGGMEPVSFVPAVAAAADQERAGRPEPRARRGRRRASASGIELEINGVAVRVGPGASPKAIGAVIRALKASS
jgi:transposase